MHTAAAAAAEVSPMNRGEDGGVCGERTAERVGVSRALMTD